MILTILRKPLEGTVAENTLKHGCGALNIDSCRISTSDNLNGGAYAENPTERGGEDMWTSSRKADFNCFRRGGAGDYEQPSGRWPANFILIGDSPVEELDRQSGVSKSTGGRIGNAHGAYSHLGETGFKDNAIKGDPDLKDEGGASRYFKQFNKKEDDQ